jgi:hypothetical protein
LKTIDSLNHLVTQLIVFSRFISKPAFFTYFGLQMILPIAEEIDINCIVQIFQLRGYPPYHASFLLTQQLPHIIESNPRINSIGERIQPCWTPAITSNGSPRAYMAMAFPSPAVKRR